MIQPDIPCGYFAPGTLLETCFQDAGFDVNVRQQKWAQISNIQKCQMLHENHKRKIICFNFSTLYVFVYVWYS